MKILIGCEFSGIVREAFRAKGHDAYSCDFLDSEDNSPYHIKDDLRLVIRREHWDIMIAHPPCTHLSSSGARWFKEKRLSQANAVMFVIGLVQAPIKKLCIENPIGILSKKIGKPTQIIQPWQFGHAESKATCLWLIGLPKLEPTNILEGIEIENKVHKEPPGPDRWKNRSRTYKGIAEAMANQWGG